MTVIHLIYLLACSISFAAMDLIRKWLTGRITPMALVFFVAVGTVPPMAVWVMMSEGSGISFAYLLPGIGSLVLNFVANLGFIYSLKLSPLSRTIPFLSLTPVFTSLMAIPLLHEIPTFWQGAGILCVVCGALVLNMDKAQGNSASALLRAMVDERGSLLMVGVAFLWSLSIPLDKMAISVSNLPLHGLILSVGVTLGSLLFLLGQKRMAEIYACRLSKGLVLALMVAASLALAFQFLSIQVLLVSVVETFKRAIGCFAAVLLGRLIFKETVTVHQLVSITVMVVGIALVLVY
jgi:drug/metabolite transporter (DMT)-like permease